MSKKEFSEDQPRDEHGRWTSGGGSTVERVDTTGAGNGVWRYTRAGDDAGGFNNVHVTASTPKQLETAVRTLDELPPEFVKRANLHGGIRMQTGDIEGYTDGQGRTTVGLYSGGEVTVRTDVGNAQHTLVHEIGHGLYRSGGNVRAHEEFRSDVAGMKPAQRRQFGYFAGAHEEAVVESMAYHVGPFRGNASAKAFAKAFPKLHAKVGQSLRDARIVKD